MRLFDDARHTPGVFFAADDPPAGDPQTPPADPPSDPPQAGDPETSDAPAGDDKKQESRAAYEARKANERATAAEKQLAHYKAREEEERKAKLTEEQRRQEEFDVLKDKAERLERENALVKIATKHRIKEEHWGRIIGGTPEELEADAERLSKISGMTTVSRAGSTTDPVRGNGGARVYTRAELRADPELARSPEVLQAHAEGRVR